MKKLIAIIALVFAVMITSAMACNCPKGCDLGNVYATSVVSADGVGSPENALGSEDFQYAIVFAGKTLVLDMGREICDSNELDLYFFNDYYTAELVNVFTSENAVDWTPVGTVIGWGIQGVELAGTGKTIRYVKFESFSGRKNVAIDAVLGKCSKPIEQVPEFTTLGAAAVLGLVGLFILKRRN